MPRLSKLTDRQKALIDRFSDTLPGNMPVREKLLYLAYEIAHRSNAILNKFDFYAVARSVVGDADLRKSKITHTLLFSYLAYGMGQGIAIKNIGEITFQQKYMIWKNLKDKLEEWRLSYQRAMNSKSKKVKATGGSGKCLYDESVQGKVYEALQEMRADLNNLTQLITDRILLPTPDDVTADGNYSLIHAYKETIRELHEARKEIALLQGLKYGQVQKQLSVTQSMLADTVNGFSENVAKLLNTANTLFAITGDNPEGEEETESQSAFA
jgi:hypothetical protein